MSFKFCHFETIWKISQGHCGPLTPTPQFRHLPPQSGQVCWVTFSHWFLKISFDICKSALQLAACMEGAVQPEAAAARAWEGRVQVKWKTTVDQNCVLNRNKFPWEQHCIVAFCLLSSSSSVKGKVDREECWLYKYIFSVFVHHSLHKVGPFRWNILMNYVQRRTAEPLRTKWRPTAVERTFSNVTNARKHLTKQNTWMIINSLILERSHTSVHSAANHFLGLIILKPTWWFTLERNYTTVHNAASHSIDLILWNDICSPILGISCTTVHNAVCNDCNKKFKHQKNLTRHGRQHIAST